MEKNSNDLNQESDIHDNTKKGNEGCLEKADDPKMERLRTENDLQLYEDDLNSTKEIRGSEKSTDGTFYSWAENDTLENTPRNKSSHFLPPSLSITFLTNTFPKTSSLDKSTESTFGDYSNQYSFTSTQETHHQVREKLESLHNVLLAYESKEGNKAEGNCILKDYILYKDAKSKKSSKVSFNLDVTENLITDDETFNSSEFEQCESIIQSSSTSLSVQSYSNMFSIRQKVFVRNPNYNRSYISNTSSEEKSDLENSSNDSINTFTKIRIESRENLSELNSDSRLNSNSRLNFDLALESHNQNYITDHKMENFPMDVSDDQISRSSSQSECSTDENSDNLSTTALLKEALQFKDALLTQLELEKEMKISQETTNEDEEHDFKKNSWLKVDNYFQTKILDIITEEQSASSSTEKTSKTFVMRQIEENNFSHQGENSKSVLGSTSSEYLSFGNLSQNGSANLPEPEIEPDKENKNDFQSEVPLLNNKRALNSEIRPDDLIKRSKYITQGEKEETWNVEDNDKKGLLVSKRFRNLKEEEIKEEKEEKIRGDKKQNKKQEGVTNYELDSNFQKNEDQNSNAISQISDSSSDESLIQFIRELTTDKAKAAKIFRESKLNLNSTKSKDKPSAISDAEEPESTLTLQRRPGSFSLAENQPKEKPLKTLKSDSHSYFESANSEVELELLTDCSLPKYISGKIELDLVIKMKEKNKEFKTEHQIDKIVDNNIDMNKNKIVDSVNSENIESGSNFALKDSTLSHRSINTAIERRICKNLREESIEEKKVKELTEISGTKNKLELQELVDNKCEYSLKEEISENLDSEEKVNESQSNLTSEPSSSLYFTAEPATSDIKLNFKYLTSSTSFSKSNLEIQETIFEDLSESLPENKICENDCVEKEKAKDSEAMLIDLSDNTPREKSPNTNLETFLKIPTNENKNSKIKNLNILDADFMEKVEEHLCLIPKKINENSESKDQDLSGIKEINISPNKIKTSEINKLPHYSSAPSLQRVPLIAKINSTNQSSRSLKSNQNLKMVEESKTLSKRPGSRENSKEHSEKREKSNENSNKEKQSSGDQNKRRSRSFASPRIIPPSPENSESIKSARDSTEVGQHIKLTSKTSIKSVDSQKSSRSSIPILKTRLENIRKKVHKSRSRSPTRGPLTISPRNDDTDLKEAREFKTRRATKGEKNDGNEKSFGDNTGTATNSLKDVRPKPNEKTVIYVNIRTDQNQSKRKVVDPRKFLEYVRSRELKNIINENKSEESKILNAVSSLIKDALPIKNLQNKFSFQVEQQEREVSVKPSVTDNSTSVSDFLEFCDDGKQNKNKFKIFQIPEELTKEEYINLLDTLNQDPNLEQLKQMHQLCSKLGVGFQE